MSQSPASKTNAASPILGYARNMKLGITRSPDKVFHVSTANAHLWLAGYAASVVVITLIHWPPALAALQLLALSAAGRERWRLLKRAALALLAFNLTISAGYALLSLWQGNFRADYLWLVNLRVLLLVFLGFWFATKINVLAALSGWPTLRLIATLAIGQMRTFTRILADFRLAFASRNIVRPGVKIRARQAAAQGITLMDKSLASANESALAMKSRGAFDA